MPWMTRSACNQNKSTLSFVLSSWPLLTEFWLSLHLICPSNVRKLLFFQTVLCSVCPCTRPRLSWKTWTLCLLFLQYRNILQCLSIKADASAVTILYPMPLVLQVSFLCLKSALWLSCVLCSYWWDNSFLSCTGLYVFSVVASSSLTCLLLVTEQLILRSNPLDM